jgi:DNA-directed RNA polymerase subunit beta
MLHPEKDGLRTRQSFSKIKEVIEMPNLIEVQKDSYNWFIEKGLQEVFDDIDKIEDYTGNLVLEFVDYSIEGKPKYSVEECKERDQTYFIPLKVTVRLINKEKNEVKEQKVYMADLHKMTDTGTFIVNGAERVIVSQLVRSPGAYFSLSRDKLGKKLFSAQVIPNRGAWLEYETDSNDIMYVKIDRTRKLPITALIRALGLGTNQEILDFYGDDYRLIETIKKDENNNMKSTRDGLIEIYKRLRPGEPPTVESAQSLLNSMFFDDRRYDLAKVGRHKYNKKLSLSTRIAGQRAANTVVNPETGEVYVEEGEIITNDVAIDIQNTGINVVDVKVEDKIVRVIGNGFVDISAQDLAFDISDLDITENVCYEVLKEILESNATDEEKKKSIKKRMDELVPKHVLISDLHASISYIIGLDYDIGAIDDIDHLGNRRLRSVGELLQNQFRIGLSRMERVVRERMSVQDDEILTPQGLINTARSMLP